MTLLMVLPFGTSLWYFPVALPLGWADAPDMASAGKHQEFSAAAQDPAITLPVKYKPVKD